MNQRYCLAAGYGISVVPVSRSCTERQGQSLGQETGRRTSTSCPKTTGLLESTLSRGGESRTGPGRHEDAPGGAQPGTLLFEPKWDDYLVCAAVIGSLTQPQAIVSGLPVNGQLRIVGRSTVLSTRTGRELGRQLRPAQPGHPWPEEISETSLNRFSKDKGPVHLTLIEPLVVEVAADVAWSGTSFRHPLTYQRARPELDPADVELPPYIKAR